MSCNNIIQIAIAAGESTPPFITIVPAGVIDDKPYYLVPGGYTVYWDGTKWVLKNASNEICAIFEDPSDPDCPFDSSLSETSWEIVDNVYEVISRSTGQYDENICNCSLGLFYTVRFEKSTINRAVNLSVDGTIAGYNYYLWTDPYVSEDPVELILYWDVNEDAWIIRVNGPLTSDDFGVELARLPNPASCPSGREDSEIPWEFDTRILTAVESGVECDPTTCAEWQSDYSESTLPLPFRRFIFELRGYPTPEDLFIGMAIDYLDFNYSPIEEGVGGYKIAMIYWQKDTTLLFEYIPGATFKGIAISDANNTFLEPGRMLETIAPNSGNICFVQRQPSPIPPDENDPEDCYSILVWNKQCEFADCVLRYIQNLQFGIIQCESLSTLKDQKRALEILNCYDSRDIENNTTDYNFFSYSEIKKLLNSK